MAPERQPANKTITLLILVAAFAAGYLFYSKSAWTTQQPITPPLISAGDDFVMLKDLTIDFSILDNSRFKSLRLFGESPVRPSVTGKKDLFAPF